MQNDPLANMIERLRGRGWQPRKVGHDAWESNCPGHGGRDHALALRRTADGKLDVKCRSVEQCSLSRIVKRLDTRIDNLFHETKPALIRKLREEEIEPSIYQPSQAIIATNEAPADADPPQRVPDADCPSSASMLPEPASAGSSEPEHDRSSSVGHPNLSPVGESPPTAGEVVLAPQSHAQRDKTPSSSVAELLKIAGTARTFGAGRRLHGVTLNKRPRRMSRPRGPRSSPLADADILRDDRPFTLDVGGGRCSRCHGGPR